MNDKTMTFSIGDQTEQEIRRILTVVYDSLKEKGYNPINQIVGYILSEDPTYITTHNTYYTNKSKKKIVIMKNITIYFSLIEFNILLKVWLHLSCLVFVK